jgi:F0F1-type ATP synthase delta subunit
MSDIKIANRYASALFQQAIAENKLDVIVKVEEVGTVLQVGDGIARVYGLTRSTIR